MYYILHIMSMLTMLLDHIGLVFYPEYDWFRIVGRMSFPLYAYFLVVGYSHTHDKLKYLRRLFIIALLSEYPYDVMHFGTFGSIEFLTNQNVCFTLCLGFGAICIAEKALVSKWKSRLIIHHGIFILAGIISFLCKTDYMFVGIFLIYCIYQMSLYKPLDVGLALIPYVMINMLGSPPGTEFHYCSVLFSIFLLYFYNNKKIRVCKWFKIFRTWFYPLHLWIITLILVIQ